MLTSLLKILLLLNYFLAMNRGYIFLFMLIFMSLLSADDKGRVVFKYDGNSHASKQQLMDHHLFSQSGPLVSDGAKRWEVISLPYGASDKLPHILADFLPDLTIKFDSDIKKLFLFGNTADLEESLNVLTHYLSPPQLFEVQLLVIEINMIQ